MGFPGNVPTIRGRLPTESLRPFRSRWTFPIGQTLRGLCLWNSFPGNRFRAVVLDVSDSRGVPVESIPAGFPQRPRPATRWLPPVDNGHFRTSMPPTDTRLREATSEMPARAHSSRCEVADGQRGRGLYPPGHGARLRFAAPSERSRANSRAGRAARCTETSASTRDGDEPPQKRIGRGSHRPVRARWKTMIRDLGRLA